MALSLCSSSVNNTGELACDKSRGVLKKIFIANGSFDSSNYADEATLFAAIVANSKLSKSNGEKVFVINEAQDISDASEANKEGSLGLGFKAVLQEGRPAYKVKIFAGGDLLKRLRAFNNQTVRIFEWDANNTFWGSLSGATFQGFQAKLFFTGNKIATGQNVEEGVVEFTLSILSTSEYFDACKWVDFSDYSIEDVKPLIDANLAKVSNVTNVVKYSIKIPDSNLVSDYNVMGDYGTEIAALTFTAKSAATAAGAATGSSLAITSTAYDSTNNLLTVTYDPTAYTAAGAYIRLIPPTPAVLDAADVVNLEIIAVTHAK